MMSRKPCRCRNAAVVFTTDIKLPMETLKMNCKDKENVNCVLLLFK